MKKVYSDYVNDNQKHQEYISDWCEVERLLNIIMQGSELEIEGIEKRLTAENCGGMYEPLATIMWAITKNKKRVIHRKKTVEEMLNEGVREASSYGDFALFIRDRDNWYK